MNPTETADHLHHLKLGGRADTLFSDDATALLHRTSRGVPRALNNLATQALIAACAQQNRSSTHPPPKPPSPKSQPNDRPDNKPFRCPHIIDFSDAHILNPNGALHPGKAPGFRACCEQHSVPCPERPVRERHARRFLGTDSTNWKREDMSADPARVGHYADQDARDLRLLRRIADARARGDELGRLREKIALGDLLAPYWAETQRIVTWRLASITPEPADIEDICSRVIEEMINKLAEATELGIPLRVVVFLRAQSRAVDYWRARKTRNRHVIDCGGEIPEVPAVEETKLVHAEVMAEIIGRLGPRDQRILVERYVAGLRPQQIADGLGVTRTVVDTACSRVLRKLRVDPRVIAVRNQMRETV